jgi:hypothetical protein
MSRGIYVAFPFPFLSSCFSSGRAACSTHVSRTKAPESTDRMGVARGPRSAGPSVVVSVSLSTVFCSAGGDGTQGWGCWWLRVSGIGAKQ